MCRNFTKFCNTDVEIKILEILKKNFPLQVKNMYVHCHYFGMKTNYANDIAIVVLENPFTFSSLLTPICLDMGTNYESIALVDGNSGVFEAFRETVRGLPTAIVQTFTVPYVRNQICMTSGPQYQSFFTSDKFCTGHNLDTVDTGGQNLRCCELFTPSSLIHHKFTFQNHTPCAMATVVGGYSSRPEVFGSFEGS